MFLGEGLTLWSIIWTPYDMIKIPKSKLKKMESYDTFQDV